MDIIIERFKKIKSNISKEDKKNLIKIIAVSKTFTLDHIMPLIEHGHIHFGENKVQEAEVKWHQIRQQKKDIKLHMIGKLQSNKAKEAVNLFDFIHSVDNLKLAEKIANVCCRDGADFVDDALFVVYDPVELVVSVVDEIGAIRTKPARVRYDRGALQNVALQVR